MNYFIAVVGLPFCFCLLSLGVGFAVEAAAGTTLPEGLLVPVGSCGALLSSLAVYSVHLDASYAVGLLVLLAGGGLVAGRRSFSSRVRPGGAAGAGLLVYLLYASPLITYGDWTWTGYNFVNDTAVQLLLVDHLQHAGTLVQGDVLHSAGDVAVHLYFGTGYPIGAHSLLATLAELLGVGPEVLYQSFLSSLAAIAGASLTVLCAACGLGVRMAVSLGVVAASANLTYQYALQGNIKEIALVAVISVFAAVAGRLLTCERPIRYGIVPGIALGALLAVYNAAGAPFALALLGALAAAWLSQRGGQRMRKRVLGFLSVVVTACLVSLPALSSLPTFFQLSTGVYQAGGAAARVTGADPLGHLARALPVTQAAGVWLTGDYRLPVPAQPAAIITALAIIAILGLLVVGTIRLFRRGHLAPLILLGGCVVTLGVVGPRVTPYAAGKLLAITGPAVLVVAGLAFHQLPSILRRAGYVLGAFLAAAVLASDFLAAHHTKLAPVERMEALRAVGDHYRHTSGFVLLNEFEEFGKYFAHRIRLNPGSEALAPFRMELRSPESIIGHYFDLDQQTLAYVEAFPVIVLRNSPAASRPPANFRLTYQNQYYQGWTRTSQPHVIDHLPIQSLYSKSLPVVCNKVQALSRNRPPGLRLIAAVAPVVSGYDVVKTPDRSTTWIPHPTIGGDLLAQTPGHASGGINTPTAGRYDVWVQGNFPRAVRVSIDGRDVGSVHAVNTPGQWLMAARITLGASSHTLRMDLPSTSLAPGDGAEIDIGPPAVQLEGPEQLESLPLSRWRHLCGKVLDWVEVVRP